MKREPNGDIVLDIDAMRDAEDARQARRDASCECDPHHEWPGSCPGRLNCPVAGYAPRQECEE